MDKNAYIDIVKTALNYVAKNTHGQHRIDYEEALKRFDAENPELVEEFTGHYCNLCGVCPEKNAIIKSHPDGTMELECVNCGAEITTDVVKAADIRNDVTDVAMRDVLDIDVDEDAHIEDNGVDGYWVQAKVFIPYP
jgi:hypothetical protein